MKFTKIATVLGLTAVCVPTMAQYEGTRVYDRIGHGQDSITTLGNIVAYKDSYKAQDYVGAYEPWKAVFTMAPCAEVSTYAYGAMILANVLVKEQDMTKKKAYFNELMNLYDTRLKHMDALNSFTKADSVPQRVTSWPVRLSTMLTTVRAWPTVIRWTRPTPCSARV